MPDNKGQAFTYAGYPDLAGKRVIVTGGGSGIGGELTAAFAGQGAQVWFLDIAEEAALALFLASNNARRCSGREYFVDAGWYGA